MIPHPQSHQSVRRFAFPSEAEVLGRVTGVAMRIADGAVMEDGAPA